LTSKEDQLFDQGLESNDSLARTTKTIQAFAAMNSRNNEFTRRLILVVIISCGGESELASVASFGQSFAVLDRSSLRPLNHP
jgi:hypothetical protein